MNYGKNQQALIKFLEKYPNKWHRIKSKKAIVSARRLENRDVVRYLDSCIPGQGIVYFDMPQMLIEQN